MPYKALEMGLPWTIQHGRASCPHLPLSEGLHGGAGVANVLQEGARYRNLQKGGRQTTLIIIFPTKHREEHLTAITESHNLKVSI